MGCAANKRPAGVSYTFGPDCVTEFLHKHDLDLVCRAHQVVEDGYAFFARRQLVTIFSAPNYCGEFDNAGAMMRYATHAPYKQAWLSEECTLVTSWAPSPLHCE